MPPPAPSTTTHSSGATRVRQVYAYSIVPYDATSPAACPAVRSPGIGTSSSSRSTVWVWKLPANDVANTRSPTSYAREVVTDRDDPTGELTARDPGEAREQLVGPVHAERVDEPDPRGLDGDDRLPVTRHRVGELLGHEVRIRTELVEDDAPHQSTNRVSRANSSSMRSARWRERGPSSQRRSAR